MSIDVTGTYLWYYNICHRELWLMSRRIVPDQHDENIDLGRFIHEHSYSRNEKEIAFGNVKFDVIFQSKSELTIGETKKSSKYKEASKWQLLFYLRVLKDAGINAKGQLLYPEERRREDVILDEGNEQRLNKMIEEIDKVCEESVPPALMKIPFCKNCGYKEYCYA